MRRAERRAHLLAWLILGPACIGLLLLALARRQPSPLDPPRAPNPGAPR